MTRTQVFPEVRQMKFEEACGGWRGRGLTQEEAARLLGRDSHKCFKILIFNDCFRLRLLPYPHSSPRRKRSISPMARSWAAVVARLRSLRSASLASCQDMIDMPLQRAGQDVYHLRHQRSQIVRSVARGEHYDDRERQVIEILLMGESAIYGKQRIESAVCGEAEQSTVARAGPSHFRDSPNLVSGWKRRP